VHNGTTKSSVRCHCTRTRSEERPAPTRRPNIRDLRLGIAVMTGMAPRLESVALALALVSALMLAARAQSVQKYNYQSCTRDVPMNVSLGNTASLNGNQISLSTFDLCVNITGRIRLQADHYYDCYEGSLALSYVNEEGIFNYIFGKEEINRTCEDISFNSVVFRTCAPGDAVIMQPLLYVRCRQAANNNYCQFVAEVCIELNLTSDSDVPINVPLWIWIMLGVTSATAFVGVALTVLFYLMWREGKMVLADKEPLLPRPPANFHTTNVGMVYTAPHHTLWAPASLSAGPGDMAPAEVVVTGHSPPLGPDVAAAPELANAPVA